MEMFLTIGDVIIIMGAFLALILSVGFFIQQKTHANLIIGILLVVCFVRLGVKFLDESGLILSYPHLSKYNYFFGLLTPPLFFIYLRYLLHTDKNFNPKDLFHFVPAVLILIYFLPYHVLPAGDKVQILTGRSAENYTILPGWYGYFGLIYSITYLAASVYLFIIRKDKFQKNFRIWIVFLLTAYGSFMLFALLSRISDFINNLDYIVFQVLSLSIMLASLRLLSLPNQVNAPTIKYRRSKLDKNVKKPRLERLESLMEDQMLFKDPKLRLSQVAERLGLNENELSQLINEELKISFNDYVNSFRIRRAQELLRDASFGHLSIEGIAYESGFNSRTSFYSAFKKNTGLTPTTYQAKVRVTP